MFSAMMLATSIFFNACKGEVGPKGDTGATGANGATGAKGDVSSANVIYSTWKPADSWVLSNYYGAIGRYFDIAAPQLTREILDRGNVYVYWKPANNLDAVIPLPTTTHDFREFFLEHKVSRIRIWFFNSIRTDPGTLPSSNEFRYVIVPGGVAGGRRTAVDYSNYEAVKKAYNLPD